MTSSTKIALLGSITVVLFDAVAVSLARIMNYPYSRAMIGSFIIYGVYGYLAERSTPSPLRAAALIGMLLGITDATIGWGVSRAVGPGRVSGLTPATWLITAVLVTGTSAIIAAPSGTVARARAKAWKKPASKRRRQLPSAELCINSAETRLDHDDHMAHCAPATTNTKSNTSPILMQTIYWEPVQRSGDFMSEQRQLSRISRARASSRTASVSFIKPFNETTLR
jgi:hypothetical protein